MGLWVGICDKQKSDQKVVWVVGTQHLFSSDIIGLLDIGRAVKNSSNSAQPFQRYYYNLQTNSKESMGNLNLGNPSHLMT